MALGGVLGLWRYPVKSMRGESVRSVTCTSQGFQGDRAWAVIAEDGTVVSAKSPKHGGALLDVTSRRRDDGTTLLSLPDGREVTAGSAEGDDELSALLGSSVRLSDRATAGLRLHRLWPTQAGLVPEWQRDSRAGQIETTAIAGAERGSFVDFGMVHVVTSAALAELQQDLAGPVDVARLRPNLLVSLDQDLEAGQTISIGEGVRLRVTLPTPRCIVPALPQGDLPAQPSMLAVLAERHRRDIPGLGRAACFGWYADVVRSGVITHDDAIAIAIDG